jgi:hypothetical protein
MKKLTMIGVTVVLCFIFSAACFAQEAAQQQKVPRKITAKPAPAQTRERQMQNMTRMFVATSKMVATTDHGVVVMVGNKLYKYDRNLRLIKEQEIKINPKDFGIMMGR